MQYGIKIIIVQHYPIVKPKMVGPHNKMKVDQETVDKMSGILIEETARYSEEKDIVIWDSFQALMER